MVNILPAAPHGTTDQMSPTHAQSLTTFATLLHARVELTDWHREYNTIRRHSSLGYKTPTEYAEHCTCTKPD